MFTASIIIIKDTPVLHLGGCCTEDQTHVAVHVASEEQVAPATGGHVCYYPGCRTCR